MPPATLLALVQRHRVTHLLGVPLIFNALVNFPALGQYDLSSLRFLLTGGAPASPVLIRAMQEKLGGLAMVGYGLTETSPVLSCARPRQHIKAAEPPGRDVVRRSMTGWAIPGIALRVVDAAGRDVSSDGETIGEIVVRSNVVMEGYYKDPEATREAIRDGWFHTGDMATIDDTGEILIRDRAKDIIISGGENISSVEIENAIYTHPDVLECAVVAAPDPRWGEIPVALVVPKPGRSPAPDELLTHLRGRLAGFKVPRQVEVRAELPRGGTGKILKAQLREPFWQGEPKRVH